MSLITNRKALEKGSQARSIMLDALEAALEASSPRKLMQEAAKGLNLSKFERTYVIGAGKAGAGMAIAAEGLFNISEGVVCVPKGTGAKAKHIEFIEAGHPFPNEGSVEGAQKILALSKKVKEEDVVICLISGGGSALLCLPREGLSLKQKSDATEFLMKAGADINELNTVRKHLSGIKGGWLANAFSHCTLHSLIISDVVGDRLDAIASGPTIPDATTFSDAKRVMERYGASERFPEIAEFISKGITGEVSETPKPGSPAFEKCRAKVIGSNGTALQAASSVLKKRGIEHELLENVTGEARDVGKELAGKLLNGISFVAGGETTVRVTGNGQGGRNQELALSCALQLSGKEGVLASMGTDGIDGNSPSAGALVDGTTASKQAEVYLKRNDSYTYLLSKGDAILTGLTGTNVNDVTIGICWKR
ncbi:MAG: DUF4147 domain-containing protein [Candidatus Micrarchaeota archaeon]